MSVIATEGADPSPDRLPADKISYHDFSTMLLSFAERAPKKIQGLEELRYNEIPKVLAQRKEDGEAFLEKTEVQSLIEWKLKFGTYRPKLATLVASNSVSEVRQTTSSAFSIFTSDDIPNPAKAISTLSKLKGIGPASASLILSCYDPTTIPFFSDELFRWLHWEIKDEKSTKRKRTVESKDEGWNRKIKYTAKEYAAIFDKTSKFRERLSKEAGEEIKAVNVEKVAYAIAKEIEGRVLRENHHSAPPPPSKQRKKNSRPPSPTPEPSYELDYEYIIRASRVPRDPDFGSKRAEQETEKDAWDQERKADIMGRPCTNDTLSETVAWDHRVAKDLGKAFHEVGVEEYEEWVEKGFKVSEVEFFGPAKGGRGEVAEVANGECVAERVRRGDEWNHPRY
ncbi:MAG: hypothetical protein Q9202_003265 [Teloschistes flavicans]